VIGHRASPGALTLWLDSFLSRTGWPVRLARLMGIRPVVKTVEHAVHIPHGAAALSNLRLAFATDFHAGAVTDPAVLLHGIESLRHANPDVLLLGGDYISVHPAQMDWLAPLLGGVPAPLGRFAVLGNHDRWVDPTYVTRRLEEAGIQVLVNRNARLPAPFDDVWICGLDDQWSGSPDAGAALSGASGVRVLLMHSPSTLLDIGEERFDLALCGHTHGGQIALPGGIPILLPRGPLSRKYSRGRFDLGRGRTMIVSVGLGCSALPLRTFADPEILLCRLRPEPEGRPPGIHREAE
jgi:predicted MPP superfamily phosphohydrolase